MKIGLIFISAAALAGCSADVSRFDLGNPEGARSHSGGYGTTGRSGSADFGSSGYDRPPSYRGNDVARSELAPTPQVGMTTSAIHPQQGGAYSGDAYRQPGYGQSPGYGANQPAPRYGTTPGYGAAGNSQYGGAPYGQSQTASPPAGASQYGAADRAPPVASRGAGAKGEMVEVRPGDTLYSLSKRHGVSISDLKTTNGLASNDLQPGQQLHLPAGTRARYATETARPPRENYETAAATPSHTPAVDAPSDWSRSYTVRPGDSLYAIARQNGVKLAELERHNGIADSRKVKPGTVIKLPGGGATPVAEAAPAAEAPPTAPPAAQTPSPAPGVVRLGEQQANPPPSASTPQQPTMLNGSPPPSGPERVAKADPGSASDAVSPTNPQTSTDVAGFSKLRWPVAGKVISPFGPRPDGTHNDGVNLATPMGTDVHAAENGVVAYAGDELKGYGNLVLIRHDNGWVTAYAHADEILVKRGDQIKRGQVIAKAGRTGQVDQPQVHFELRQGQKPVDPTPFMERL